jgi:3-hydroxyacyl-[acyl-carrier-protein] dehydratase
VTISARPLGHFVIAPDHPSLPGHFPGQPIVPGVVLLDNVVSLILAHLKWATLAGIAACKFTAAVSPGQVVEVACSETNGERIDVLCSVAGVMVARGTILLRPAVESAGTPGGSFVTA